MALTNETLEECALNFYEHCIYSYMNGAHEMLFEIDN